MMTQNIDIDTLRQKVRDALLKSAIDYYEADRACYEISVPRQWEDDKKKAYNEFIERCQDYELVNESDDPDLGGLKLRLLMT